MGPLKLAAIAAIARNAMLAAGAIGMFFGHHIPDDMLRYGEIAIAAILTVVSVVWSQYNVYRNEQSSREREHRALNAGIEKSNSEPGRTPPVPLDEALAVIHEFGDKAAGI
jgi:hypothetical protein